MAATPRPGQDGVPVDVDDRRLWVLLCALVAHRPALTGASGPIDADSRHMARARIASTARGVEELAEDVSTLLAQPHAPDNVRGSARALAASVVRLCRAFAQSWAPDGVVIARPVAEFNREVQLLETCLDGIATRFADKSQ